MPKPVQYSGLSKRTRRTIELYAIEGMPAALIANELGLKESTIHGYIKDAYEALGLHDHDDSFLANLSQRERAFMKLTALEEPHR